MTPADRHARFAQRFTEVSEGVIDWDAPTPVSEWRARDVVDHLVTWFGGFLAAGTGIELGDDPTADPVVRWEARAAEVQGLLAERGDQPFRHPHVGETTIGDAVDRFYTSDVFMHTWDLARSSGQDDRLDPDTCAAMLAGMEPMDDLLRASGQYGPRVDVPAGADVQDRLIAFIGRDPRWRP